MEQIAIALAGALAKNGDIFVDVGAGVYAGGADYVGTLKNIVGATGKIYAFDPFNIDFPQGDNVISVKRPVWSSSGKIKSSLLFPMNVQTAMSAGQAPTQEEEYETVALDDYFPTENINLIKIDIEGAEYAALQGAKNILNRNHDIKIFLECHWGYFIKFGYNADALWDFLNGLGFYIHSYNDFKPIERKDFNSRDCSSNVFLMKETFDSIFEVERNGDNLKVYEK